MIFIFYTLTLSSPQRLNLERKTIVRKSIIQMLRLKTHLLGTLNIETNIEHYINTVYINTVLSLCDGRTSL